MRKIYPIYLLCSLLAIALCFVACHKQEPALRKGPKKNDQCRVSSMRYSFPFDSVLVSFSYNKSGDPLRITQTNTGTGRPDGFFLYNNKKQLTDYIGLYNDNTFEFWHRYVYDKNGRIVRDTVFYFGFIDNGEPDLYYDVAVVAFEYDQQERISHTSQAWYNAPGFPLRTDYSYDARGNLVIPGVVYDDQPAIHRTSPVWMFIDRNYSVNNGYATGWNGNGLPTHMGLSSQGGQFAGFYNGNLSNIEYLCSGDRKGIVD
ncbi:hypothetical protein [Paraflavitalea sp. CAU 1676]|uniref:hypothetical protein n=1 Tax=Paraflavitalea sp. CAU 1676 TaxID=3032598 RepID=UPI0023DC68AA|nr:hypothetical protein [Paraflavitalea sp. CAU 1676]MDF2191979.1 hypothetical protein [Paraflavitalea sp. CAU 1676]